MFRTSILGLGVVLCLAARCAGDQVEWLPDQINSTICTWDSPRAAVVRDTLYIDGGMMWYQPGMANGTLGGLVSDSNPSGLVYLLNFSTPFNTSGNFSSILTTISKAPGGGNANNIGPQYYDGAMLANDYQWFAYGGRLDFTDAYRAPEGDSIAKYMKYQSGPARQFQSGWQLDKLPENMTRYVTNGAAVSVPSENLGFYFGGLRERSWGSISTLNPQNASYISSTLIEVDMASQLDEVWQNYTLPSSVPGRAGAEIVWVPVSAKGVLIAIGGVIFPSYATNKNNASAIAQSEKVSPEFMSTVAVYDIDKRIWYEQKTSGKGPGQLTQGCTALASAQDGSSHNIYWYGGFDGLNPASLDAYNDDVWVLSIPSFMWMKVKSGSISHGRAGHKCVKPYPDQMFVVGGFGVLSGALPQCVENGVIQIFNLSSAEWINSYNPEIWSEYSVPSTVYQTIGGSSIGGASQSQPPDGYSNASMALLFGTAYNTTKISKWYPYEPSQVENNNNTTASLPKPEHKSSTPSYLAPVLGVVLGLFFITLVVLIIMLYRRRKLPRHNGTATQSEAETIDNRRWVTTWLRGTPVDAKAPTVTTDETPTSAYEDEPQADDRPTVPEMGEGQVHELMDTSLLSELHDTGFIPVHETDRGGLAASPSVTSHTSQSSTVSRVSQVSGRPPVSPFSPPQAVFPGVTPESEKQRRIVSDMSGVSDGDRGHLRGISETSVSTIGGSPAVSSCLGDRGNGAPSNTPAAERPGFVSPLTPPEGVSSDYLGASVEPQNERRRSNFLEELNESSRK